MTPAGASNRTGRRLAAAVLGYLIVIILLLTWNPFTFSIPEQFELSLWVGPPDQPSPTLTQTPIVTALAQPVISLSRPAPEGMLYTVRFVGHFISGSDRPCNVYYYADDGSRQLLASIGDAIDKTFQVRFARSLRVHVELEAGTIWREELYVNDALVASGEVDNAGLSYSVP